MQILRYSRESKIQLKVKLQIIKINYLSYNNVLSILKNDNISYYFKKSSILVWKYLQREGFLRMRMGNSLNSVPDREIHVLSSAVPQLTKGSKPWNFLSLNTATCLDSVPVGSRVSVGLTQISAFLICFLWREEGEVGFKIVEWKK